MKNRFSLVAALTAAALASGAAFAQSAPVAASDAQHKGVFDELDRVRADNALMHAEIENATLHHQLLEAQAGHFPNAGGQPSAFGSQPMMPTQAPVALPAAAPAARGAMVEMVTTSPAVNSGAPTALVQMPNGGRVSATVGTKLAGVGTVQSVSVHAVLVNDGKHTFALPFDGEDQAALGGN